MFTKSASRPIPAPPPPSGALKHFARRSFVLSTLGLGLAATTATASQGKPALHWRQRQIVTLNTVQHLRVAHTNAHVAESALNAATHAIREVDASMNLRHADGELYRLNRDGRLHHPSARFLALLTAAQKVAERSQGAFDITVHPLWETYAAAQAMGRMPSPGEWARACSRVGWQHLQVHDDLIALKRRGMGVTLNGIASGYAADVARTVLAERGIEHALVDTGESVPVGRNEKGQPWTLGLPDPYSETRMQRALSLDGRCIATSTDPNHACSSSPPGPQSTLDRPSAHTPPRLLSVTVAAPSAMLADALTKVMLNADPAHITHLAQDWHVDVLWVDTQQRWGATPGLRIAA